jgi:peptidoglycan/LPS O-acetylase OafA/YrhL
MYLTHFAVIEAFTALGLSSRLGGGNASALLHDLGVVAVTAGASWPCYRLIERPGIDAGRRLIERREAAIERYGTIGV